MKSAQRFMVLALPLALTAGCVARSELDAVKKLADTCEQDKGVAQKAAADCQSRMDGETRRWDAIQAQLSTTLPQTLKEFQDERTRIIQLVPQEVRKEVAQRMDRYFINVTKQFKQMDGQLVELRDQLVAARAQVTEIAVNTRSVDTKVDATHEAVVSGQSRLSERMDMQGKRAAEVVSSILDFDSNRVNCEKCDNRIRLKGDGQEQLLAFHASLIKQLQEIQPPPK